MPPEERLLGGLDAAEVLDAAPLHDHHAHVGRGEQLEPRRLVRVADVVVQVHLERDHALAAAVRLDLVRVRVRARVRVRLRVRVRVRP